MYNPDEIVSKLSKYITKLNKTICNNADFSWFKKKYINKKRVDDILCCIEASLPEEYRGDKKRRYRGMVVYKQITSFIRVQSRLNKDWYAIDYTQVSACFDLFLKSVKSDIKSMNEIS